MRRKGNLKLCWDELNKIPEVDFPQDDIKPVCNWLANSKVVLPGVVIYTDGSRMDISGCAYAACKGDVVIVEEIIPLGDVTVFKAELIAL